MPLGKKSCEKKDAFLLFPVHLFLGAETQYASKFKSVLADGRRDKTELSFVCLCVPFFRNFSYFSFFFPGLSFPLHYGPEQPRIQTEVIGHSLVRSLVRSHRSLVGQRIIGWLFILCFFLFSTIVERRFIGDSARSQFGLTT